MASASTLLIIPFSMAVSLSLSGSMPEPSSWTLIMILSACSFAAKTSWPWLDLSCSSLISGDSMPWSTAFRIKCSNGDFNWSTKVLSNLDSSPSIIKSISFFSSFSISLTALGKKLKTVDIGTKRMSLTIFCSLSTIKLFPDRVSEYPVERLESSSSTCSVISPQSLKSLMNSSKSFWMLVPLPEEVGSESKWNLNWLRSDRKSASFLSCNLAL